MNLYFAAILPPPRIETEIRSFKVQLKERYHTSHALKLPAHVTLQIPFRMVEDRETLLKQELSSMAEGCDAFVLHLDGFGSFPPRVLYVKVVNHEPVLILHKRIHTICKKYATMEEKQRKEVIHPHVNIASRDLKKEVFQEAWKSFQEKNYKTDFLVDHFCLFRHNGRCWDLSGQFLLGV